VQIDTSKFDGRKVATLGAKLLKLRSLWCKFAVWVPLFVLLLDFLPANAVPVAARAAQSAGRPTAGPLTINKPTGTTVGDVMVASVGYRPCSNTSGGGCTTSITAPTGWTLIRLVEQKTGGGTGGYGLRLGIYRKTVTASEPTSYTWSFGGAPAHNGAAGVVSSFMNVDTANPIVIDNGQSTPSSRSHATPNVGVLATNTMLVSTHAALSSATWTPPAGMVEILDWKSESTISDLGMSLEINNEQRPAPGLTGIRTATFSSPPAADAGATHILALRPIQADPTIAMARSGNLIVGSTASYDLTIGNLGPASISAVNVRVTNTLPAGLTYASRTGTGWTCSAVGQVVTCTYSGAALLSGGTLPVLTLTVNVVSGSLWTNSASVSSGADGDNDLTNSTVTDTWPTVTTTLATGTDPVVSTIAPSVLATDVNSFTLKTSNATEPISSVTVNLSSSIGIDTLAITDNTDTVLGSVAFPATTGAITIPVIGMTATTTLQTFKVRVTPLVHVSMPSPPGGAYTIMAPVTAWTGPAAHVGSDTNTNALTIDNASPNSATAISATAGTQKVTLNWTTSSSTDFSTTNGTVIYRWVSATPGTEVPIEGSSPLLGEVNGTATVACVRSSAASTAMLAVDGSGGSGGCSTMALVNGQPYSYKIFQKDTRGNYDAGVWGGSVGTSTPGGFNAFETATAANSITGVIKTKIAGSTYNLDLVALDTAGTAVFTSFTGNVTVDLIANTTTGVSLDTDNCPVSGTTLTVGTGIITAGRSTIDFPAVPNTWRDVRVRIRYPTTSPTATKCSSDNFAIRPSSFVLAASDSDWGSAGTARSLSNVLASSGVVHKAGSPFTIRVNAFNAAATPVITSNYAGSPTVSVSNYLTPSTCTTCTLTPGTLNASAGSLTSNTASYNEVGTFVLQAVDTTFASVDATDSTTAERYIAGTVSVGRFVPDHFDVTVGQNGSHQAGCGVSFTYTGQAMSYGSGPTSLPTLTIKPMNAASSGNVTQNYQGVLQKLVASGITITSPTTDATQLGKDGATPAALLAAMAVGDLSNTAGTMTYTLKSTDTFTYTRNANALIGPFVSNIALVAAAVAEPSGEDGVSAGGALPTLSPTGVNIRYGRVRLVNAYGSELLDLPMSMRSEYLGATGGAWLFNNSDTCTNASLSFTPVGTDITTSTCVWDTGVSPGNSGNACTSPILVSSRQYKETGVAGFAGDFNLWLKRPGTGKAGSMKVIATVPAWLQFNWTGTGNSSPTARATFGIFGASSPIIYRRENY
jgi:uncharacterized repeat protein (TIGR01451 family)